MKLLILTEKFSYLLLQEHFPNPQSLANDLHNLGFKATWMLDPGIKCDEGYFVYDSGSESDVWVQSADGIPFTGGFLVCFTPTWGHPKKSLEF